MKRIVVFLVAFLAVTLISAAAHKYYVAVFQVEYVAKKKELQITSRIFIDDFEKELNKKYNKKFYLGTERELPLNDYLQTYFTEKVKFTINGKAKTIKYLGKEIEDDVIICYFTVPAAEAVKSVSVKNTTLFESFPDQQNYIHIKINSNKKSLLLTNDEQQGTLQF
jgi:hypothetical protein